MSEGQWRLIPLLEASGRVQMAIDRWLLQQHRQANHPPTLRFYTWSPAAISLGYHQRHYPEFWQNLIWQGKPLDIVRRPSGGRAVLHQGDLTYAVVRSAMGGKRTETYRHTCQFLIEGWRSLGIQLHYGSTGRGYIHNPNCFGTATEADLLDSRGNKSIGSAQLRQGNSLLQHGSMILSPDPLLFRRVFGNDRTPTPPLNGQQERNTFIPTLVNALIESASHCWKIKLVTQPLSEAEWKQILTLGSILT